MCRCGEHDMRGHATKQRPPTTFKVHSYFCYAYHLLCLCYFSFLRVVLLITGLSIIVISKDHRTQAGEGSTNWRNAGEQPGRLRQVLPGTQTGWMKEICVVCQTFSRLEEPQPQSGNVLI